MRICYLIKIPFATKGEIKQKQTNSLKISGYANYLYDIDGKIIIHEYLELTNANYRLTDKVLIKPTCNYSKPLVKKFRDEILDPITNHNHNDIIKVKFNDLNQYRIKKINNYLKLENNTIRNQFSYFKGANPSGANGNSKTSELICMNQNYFGCNFANLMKKFYKKQKDFLRYKIDKEISIIELIKENKTFMRFFQESNIWYFFDQDISDLERKIETKSEENYDKNNTISSVQRELNNKNLPFCASKKKYDSAIIKNSHIISFAELVKLNTRESIMKAINPFNVLRIDANHHKLFDNNKITFDLEGNIIKNDGVILDKSFLDIDNLPKRTINFLQENYQYWNIHNRNK